MNQKLDLALIADSFIPFRSSAAVQLYDLSKEFIKQGHSLTVILPCSTIKEQWKLEKIEGIKIIKLKSPRNKNINFYRRAFSEILMPYYMLRNLKKSPISNKKWDGLVWYSPSIFHGPLVRSLKEHSKCKSYLIVRDIFPQWALDVGLIKKGILFWFFSLIANYQYSIANTIGVQTSGNLIFFKDLKKNSECKIEVLKNWLAPTKKKKCSINIANTSLVGRKIFIYAGNMGAAQGLQIFIDLAARLKKQKDIGFIFVGRGTDKNKLKNKALMQNLNNIIFFDEIDHDEVEDLYDQCTVGIIALDHRHKTHNIPGKFLSYMQSGLPVLANVNKNNDLIKIIKDGHVGCVSDFNDVGDLVKSTNKLLQIIENDNKISYRCKRLFSNEFSVSPKVKQIVQGFIK